LIKIWKGGLKEEEGYTPKFLGKYNVCFYHPKQRNHLLDFLGF